jgi:hypothetical protein
MNEGNWLKLHRKMLEWEWYDHTNTKVVFIHCLLKANFEKKRWRGIEINAGEFITSLETMASETGLTIKQVRTALDNLEMTKDIDRARSEKGLYTMISIVSWDKYQDKGQANGKPRANLGQGKGKPRASTKEGKEREEGKEVLGNLIEKFDITVDSDFDKVFDQPFFEWLKLQKGWDAHRAKRALKQFASYKASKKQEIDTVKALRGGALVYLNYENIKQQFK